MSNIGKAIGLMSLMNAAIPHEIDHKRRDSDCIQICKECKKIGADKSPTGSHSYCMLCPLYTYSYIANSDEKE